MKAITIIEFNKFNSCTGLNSSMESNNFENFYRSGYWNVFKYSEELERFLIENKIAYKIENQ